MKATWWCRRGDWQRYSCLTRVARWCSTVDSRRRDEGACGLVLDGDLRRCRDLLISGCIMKTAMLCVECRWGHWHRYSCLTKATRWCVASRRGDWLRYSSGLTKAAGWWCLSSSHSRGESARDLMILGRDLWRCRGWLRHDCLLRLEGWLATVASRRADELTRDWVLRSVPRVSLLLAPQSGLPPPLLGLDDLVEQFAELDKDPARGVSNLPGSGSGQGQGWFWLSKASISGGSW